YFNACMCALINIGEQTGKLNKILTMLAYNEERKLFFFKKLQETLLYPLLMLALAFILTLGMLIFIIPVFADLFQDMQGKLPLITRVVFYTASFLQEYLLICVMIFILLVFIFYKHKNRIFRITVNFFSLLPIVKTYVKAITLARFARNLE